jgi:nitrogen-specific signal transduction histidine kinase
MSLKTQFALAERAAASAIRRQHKKLAATKTLSTVLSAVPELVAVLNQQRQLVYANAAALGFFNAESSFPLCGRRPGELFNCTHSTDMEYGCGTSPACRNCGAVQAILETQSSNLSATRDCTIVARNPGRELTYNFRVITTPFVIKGERFILISLSDIGEQKRKGALERIFFHDILNTASSLKVYIDLIKRSSSDKAPLQFVEELEGIADSLVEEIQSQKMLVSAENGTLEVQKNLISSAELIDHVVKLFVHDELAEGIDIQIAPFSETLTFISDEAILRRVLVNAAKNALEAAAIGATVTIGFGGSSSAVEFFVQNPGLIDESVQTNIFKRYYSTKGGNRGLGTYSMKLLTEQYLGGEVSFVSTADRGTTFTFTIPNRGVAHLHGV